MRADGGQQGRLGEFTLEAEIGRGGMGVVYLAHQPSLDRRVALKVIVPELSEDPAFRDRFEREARHVASLDHPNIVPIFGAGEADGRLYIAMRYVKGQDLGALLATRGRLAPAFAAHVADQLGDALDAAHANGLVHRDVKPANVLLADGRGGSHAYLTDFGVTKDATQEGAGLTQTGQWVGTVDYIAPEQFDGRPVDARSDVYALGCVLFEMVAGHVPFGGTTTQKMWGHTSQPPPSLVAAGEEGARLDPVVARALAKNPDERYQSAGDLGRAAVAAVAGQSVGMPERSVAVGVAATGDQAPTRPGETQPPWRGRPAPPVRPQTAVAPPPTVMGQTPRPAARRRSRVVVPALLALVLVGLAAGGVVLASRDVDGDSGDSTPAATREPAIDTAPRTSTTPARQLPKTVAFREYTPSTGGYATQIPEGPGWSKPSETEPSTKGQLYRTTLRGPGGMVLIIDYTPTEAASFGGSATATRTVDQAAFGTATEYEFTGGVIPQCETRQCVDYIVNDAAHGGGYGILAGGSRDFARAKRIALKVTQSMVYSD